MPARLWFVLSAAAVVIALAACGRDAEPLAARRVTELSISVPAVVEAGRPLVVTVTLTTATDAPAPPVTVTLFAQGTFGDRVVAAQAQTDQVQFTLDPETTAYAGVVSFTARAGGREARAQSRIRPGAPADPIVTLVGPRSLTAAAEATMFTAIVRDAWRNPVADGTPVTVRRQPPSAPTLGESATPLSVTHTVATGHLLAWTRVPAGTQAGRMRLVATAGAAHSAERDVLVVPGQPVNFRVEITPAVLPADGRQRAELRTTTLADQFGNVLPDGTAVTFLVERDGVLVHTLPAQVIDGRAATVLQAPTTPHEFHVRATVGGAAGSVPSPAAVIRFTLGPAIEPFAVLAHLTADAVALTAGPLVGDLGQFVADGTPVHFRATDRTGQIIEGIAPAEQGYARLELRLAEFASGPVRVAATVGRADGTVVFEAP